MTKKLHILFLCGWFPSKEFPTNGDFIERHAKAVSLKHKVSALHIVSSKNVAKTTIEKSNTNNLTTYIGYVKYTNNPVIKAIRFYKTFLKIIKLIGDYNIIHLNTLYPYGFFALHQQFFRKKEFIISEHWTGYLNSRNNEISFFQKIFSNLITKNATYICPVSHQLKEGMLKLGLKGNYFPVGNVVDTNTFIPSDKKNKTFTIVHVSGLNDAQKNSSGMIKVAKLLEKEIIHFKWKFIGGTSENYKNLIEEQQFNTAKIQFINHVSQTELATHLQDATICVSFSNYETFGIVMTEAIACGTYTISTNTGILNEIEQQDFFTIIPVKDKNALVREIVSQYKNPAKLNTEKMHSFIQDRFSQEIISEVFSNLYYKTLHKNS